MGIESGGPIKKLARGFFDMDEKFTKKDKFIIYCMTRLKADATREERIQKIRAENCARARQAKAGYDSGARIATTSKTGERIILDDEARAAEVKRLQSVIQSECN